MLILEPSAYEALLEHAREESPAEACGLLVGTMGERDDRRDEDDGGRAVGDSPRVERIRRMRNAAPNPEITYEIEPEEQFRAMKAIEADGREVVGFYHSHPRGPEGPSTTDHARAAWTGYHHLIVSLGGDRPMLDTWVWTGDGFARDDISVTSP